MKAAKLDLAFAVRAGATVESVVASMPVGPDGDKQFTERLEEWVTLSAKTGQMIASDKAKEEKPKAVPIGGTSAAGTEKKNYLGMI